jgi:hypothetical protein
LLTAFLDAPQRPLTREHLLQATRVHEDVFDRSIDLQILRLRRKLETDLRAPSIIQTERGVGYTFALPASNGSRSDPATSVTANSNPGMLRQSMNHSLFSAGMRRRGECGMVRVNGASWWDKTDLAAKGIEVGRASPNIARR